LALGFNPSTETVKEANLDLSVPESPAFTVLGLTPQNVVRPTTPGEFAASLLNGVDANGNLQTGIALDTTPYLTLAGNQLTLSEYRRSRMTRLLSRTQISLATAKGSSEQDKAIRLGLGFHLTPWDRGDPRMDTGFDQCLNEGLKFPPLVPGESVCL
jgi:hypothetical protein